MFVVYAEFATMPVGIINAGIVVTDDFAAYVAGRGFVDVVDYTREGGNIEYRQIEGGSFVVKVGEYADRAVAEAVADAVNVAGLSTR